MRRLAAASVAIIMIAFLAYISSAQPPRRRPLVRTGPKSSPIPRDDVEKKILGVLDNMDKNERRGMMNVSKADGRFLRVITESIGAKHVVEIGTSNGYSGIWICLGLLNTGGRLTTHEIDKTRAGLAQENFKKAGVDKIAKIVLGDAHDEVVKLEGPIDILFLDADKEGYIDYLNKLLPKLRDGGLILAHNTRSHTSSMKKYLDAITSDKNLETIFVLEQGAGMSVTLKKRKAE